MMLPPAYELRAIANEQEAKAWRKKVTDRLELRRQIAKWCDTYVPQYMLDKAREGHRVFGIGIPPEFDDLWNEHTPEVGALYRDLILGGYKYAYRCGVLAVSCEPV